MEITDKYLFNLIIPVFNIIVGVIGLLIGFERYKPFKREVAKNYHKKYETFFKIGGLGMLFWGVINLLKIYF